MPERETKKFYRCRCVIVHHCDREIRCDNATSVDQPFCPTCEDRHAGRVELGDIKEVTAVPIGVAS